MATPNTNPDFEQESDRRCEAQIKFYDKLNYHKVFADKKEVIRHFIESEDEAKEYVFQGKFYPMAHYEIAKIVKTKMKVFDENEIVKTFYHLLRLGNGIFKMNDESYSFLQKAMALLLPDLEESKYLVCHMHKNVAYLLFEVLNEKDKNNIPKTSYKDYLEIRDFIWKSTNYSSFLSMRKNREKFIIFLENRLLLDRVKKAVIIFSENKFHQNIGSNFYFAACILLLLLSEEKESKEALFKLHEQNLSNHLVWVLGSFYKEFQNTSANKEVLIDLYQKYSADLIDEYQEKKYDWEEN